MTIAIHNLGTDDGLAAAEALLGKLRLGTALVAGDAAAQDDDPRLRRDPVESVAEIIRAVREDGDTALLALTELYDKVALEDERIQVEPAELASAHGAVDRGFLESARVAIRNIEQYQRHIKPAEPPPLRRDGMTEGLRLVPLDRVGCYVPGGAAAYPSSVLMLAIPAIVAGVGEVAICCPPRAGGDISPLVLAVCHEVGIREVYRVGGAQAIAAMAFGTETVGRVDKIVGPGNLFVQLAKKQLYGQVDIDSFAGPSEVLVVADESADPRFVAADLLAQAEHAPGCGLMITTSAALADRTAAAVDELLARCSRADAIDQSLDEWSAILVADDEQQMYDWANRIAPEHLELVVADAERAVSRIRHAGVIFVGPHTPVATGDYIAGSSHVLPTGGTARYFAGLSVFDFLRPVGVVQYTADGLAGEAGHIIALAEAEGLDAHALSVRVRFE